MRAVCVVMGTEPQNQPTTTTQGESKIEEAARATRESVRAAFHELSRRPGLRLGVAGVALVALAVHLGSGSAWTIPVLVAGGVLVAAASLRGRLSGHLALDWGRAGASFEMRAQIAPVDRKALPSPATPQAVSPAEELEVIESSGETIEIELAQLKALLPDH